MSTHLSNPVTKTHSNPLTGEKADVTISFDLGNEGYVFDSAKIIILESVRGGASIRGRQPDNGASGNIDIEVHWWIESAPPPPAPKFGDSPPPRPPEGKIKFQVSVESALGSQAKDHAVILAIAEPGVLPTPEPLTGAALTFLGDLVPFGEDAMLRTHVFNTHSEYRKNYSRVIAHTGNACTQANILDSIKNLTSDNLVVDLVFACNAVSGRRVGIALHGESLLVTDIDNWITDSGINHDNLGVVYQMNSGGSALNSKWINMGFKASVGPSGGDWMPEFMCSDFWLYFLTGDKVTDAANKAWEEAKKAWSFWGGPDYAPTVTYTVGFSGIFPSVTKVETDSARVTASKLVVAGNGNRRCWED